MVNYLGGAVVPPRFFITHLKIDGCTVDSKTPTGDYLISGDYLTASPARPGALYIVPVLPRFTTQHEFWDEHKSYTTSKVD